MEEAVEICKLRLFLKLVAQLESYDQIEPLPDIDFNVRAGNTLVGFATLQAITDAAEKTPVARGSDTPATQERMIYAEEEAKLDRIEEDAELAARAFPSSFVKCRPIMAWTPATLPVPSSNCGGGWTRYAPNSTATWPANTASARGTKEAYKQWRTSHQPFHWFVEFYDIMQKGGFDVIVGKPAVCGI